ncbi:MAG: AAA family ATPase [Acidimicrobiaceae bacterium]|nr:AAA family ATPase [Acidimicrobiaceae bacterium]MYB85982.1 AAA family ATPase [Acidimicrobiaceae bacterium]
MGGGRRDRHPDQGVGSDLPALQHRRGTDQDAGVLGQPRLGHQPRGRGGHGGARAVSGVAGPAQLTRLAARPAPGSKLGPSEASLSAACLEQLGLADGDAVALRNGDHKAWAVVRTHDHDDKLVRLGRMLWPQLAVRPGEPMDATAVGELPEAQNARITPPYNLTFNLHQRLLERLRDDGTPLYGGNRVLAEIYPGGAGMLVRIDLASPSPSRMGDSTEVELHRADVSVSERLITLADVGGCDPIIRRLRELVELPLLRPAFYRRLGVRPPKGVLLHGPPGTGKTLICKALANELGVTAYRMSATELVGSVQGETEANLRLLFSRALAHAPSLVMIDEFDVIATNRERLASQSDVRAASQLLTLMDGLEEVDGLILMATTNRIQAIDPAFRRPGRFEEEIFVGPPNEEARAEILSIHTREMPLTAEAQDAIATVAADTGGFTGADLMHLARSAGLEAADRLAIGREGFELADSLEGTELAVEPGDLEAALLTVRPSVLRDVVTRTDRITWDQIVGLADLKARLRELGQRAVDSDRVEQGVLLHGPAGSGKSALVHALASELGVNFVAIEGSKVYNQWLGESEEAVRALFRRAAEARPSLVMLDHLDALAPVRAGESGERTDERVVSALLASLDDVLAEGQVFVVGVSNRPELIDEAVLRSGRLGVHLEVANPDADRRGALIAALATAHGLELDEDLTAELADGTGGWSAADIVMLVAEAASRSALQDRTMGFDDLVEAMPAITRL